VSEAAYLSVAIAGLAAVTLIARGSFFALPASVRLPVRVERALRYAPACALMAVIAPALFSRDGRPYVSIGNDQMWGVLVATAVFVRTRSMIAMMVVGMAVFTALRLWV
jgi:branched-subunit amino acid transport protein